MKAKLLNGYIHSFAIQVVALLPVSGYRVLKVIQVFFGFQIEGNYMISMAHGSDIFINAYISQNVCKHRFNPNKKVKFLLKIQKMLS